jgi:hypothetical protein
MYVPSDSKLPLERSRRQSLEASCASSLAIALLTLALVAPARSQDPPPTAEAIAKAARDAREHKANSTGNRKLITNEDLIAQTLVPSAPPSAAPDSPSAKEPEVAKPHTAGCDNPNAERLQAELLAAQAERNQLRSDLSSQANVISNNDVDLKNFKPGSAGLNVGAPALLETQSPNPARVEVVTLEEKVDSLKRALRIACDSPEDAGIQAKIDTAEQELNSLQRQIALDQDTYFSNPNHAGDTAGKAKLDAELEQKQSLESEIEHLKSELSAPKPN